MGIGKDITEMDDDELLRLLDEKNDNIAKKDIDNVENIGHNEEEIKEINSIDDVVLEVNPSPKEESITKNHPIKVFIDMFKIAAGTFPIKALYMKRLYDKANILNSSFDNNYQFTLELGKFIPYKDHYFYINESYFSLDKKAIEILLSTKSVDSGSKSTAKKKFRKLSGKKWTWDNHFKLFVVTKNIHRGEFFVPIYVLYNWYDKYTYDYKQKQRMQYEPFIDLINKYFITKNIKTTDADSQKCVGISDNYREVFTSEYVRKVKKWDKEIPKKKKRKRRFLKKPKGEAMSTQH